MGSQEITFLLGAGASMPAGLPGTAAITDRVIAGNDIWRHTDQRFYLGTSPGPSLLPGDHSWHASSLRSSPRWRSPSSPA